MRVTRSATRAESRSCRRLLQGSAINNETGRMNTVRARLNAVYDVIDLRPLKSASEK